MMRLSKYQGLGNDYFIADASWDAWDVATIRSICDRHYGAGSDGILLDVGCRGSVYYDELLRRCGNLDDAGVVRGVRIMNPDGSEAEKSGNGLRIFAQWLYDRGQVELGVPFKVLTLGGIVTATVHESKSRIEIEIGRATFESVHIPMTGVSREVLDEEMVAGDRAFRVSCTSVGNPHCVVLAEDMDQGMALSYGPIFEVMPCFPNRTNVQFMRCVDRHRIQIEIWERGAGYTLASGSSSSASAAVAVRLGLCDSPVTVEMPGGELEIVVDSDFGIVLSGPASHICDIVWGEGPASE